MMDEMSDGEKIFWIIVISLMIVLGVILYNQTCVSGPPVKEDLQMEKAREDFKRDFKEKEENIKPVKPETPVPPVIKPVGEDYNQFRKNFKNLRDEQDASS